MQRNKSSSENKNVQCASRAWWKQGQRAKIWEELRGQIILRKSQGHAILREESALRLNDVFFGGILFGLLGSRLGPPEYYRVELTTFVQRNPLVSRSRWDTRRESRNV